MGDDKKELPTQKVGSRIVNSRYLLFHKFHLLGMAFFRDV